MINTSNKGGRPKKVVPKKEIQEIFLSKYAATTPNISRSGKVVYFNRDINARDNSMFEYMLDLSTNTSSTHSNLLALKRDLTYGLGFVSEDLATQAWLEQVNSQGDSGNDLLEKISDDWSIFEASALMVVWSKDGSNITDVYHVEMQKLRAEEANEFGHVVGYFMRENWIANSAYEQTILKNYRKSTNGELYLPVFNPKRAKLVWTEEDEETKKNPELIGTLKEPVQILYMRRHTSSQPYYTTPSWTTAIDSILLEKNLQIFNLSHVENGFFPSMLINVIGASPTDEDRAKYIQALVNSFSGAHNTSKAFVEFVENKDQATIVTPIQQNEHNSEMFNTMIENAVKTIASAHRAAPELAGVVTKGADMGGDSNKLAVAHQLFFHNVIKGYQNTILKYMNKLTKAMKLGKLDIANEMPLFLVSESLLTQIMTKDELRKEFAGLGPMPKNEDTTNNENE